MAGNLNNCTYWAVVIPILMVASRQPANLVDIHPSLRHVILDTKNLFLYWMPTKISDKPPWSKGGQENSKEIVTGGDVFHLQTFESERKTTTFP
jgi:hypothetical protein